MTASEYRRKLENHGYDHDEVEEMVSTWSEDEFDRQRDERMEENLVALKAMGYTEEDLERSNPYNQWMEDVPL